ncbi:MAG: transglutaminase-like cysteine peptidase [Bdellovibrionota bacterium]
MRLPVNRIILLLLGFIPAGAFASATTAPFYFETFTLAPMNSVIFCQTYPAECETTRSSLNKKTTEAEQKKQLNEVNESVNNKITADGNKRGDPGVDPWLLFPKTGNCADYAVSKRHKLLELGWAAESLLLANVKTKYGAGHTILVVRTGGENLVLDSLTKKILPVSKTGYDWLSIQSPDNPKFWYSAKQPASPETAKTYAPASPSLLHKAELILPNEASEEESTELK